MGSSPGFVSNPCDYRPIQTRFRSGYGCLSLNLATEINSQAHSPRGTPSGLLARTRISAEHRPSIALRLLVSIIDRDERALAAALPSADLVELRLDLLGGDWRKIALKLDKPWIACNRR